jgi:predicted permease
MIRLWHVVRSLVRTPVFTVAAVGTFALGIGLNIAVLAVTDRVLLRDLPYEDPERLVVMREFRGNSESLGMPSAFVVEARQASGIQELTLVNWYPIEFHFTPDLEDRRAANFVPVAFTALKTLGVKPLLGRDFTEEDAQLQKRYALISYEVWQRDFGGKTDALGKLLWGSTPGDIPHEIVGVLPKSFIPPQLASTGAWGGLVLGWQVLNATTTSRAYTPPIARLKPGVSLSQAQAEVDGIVKALGPVFVSRPGVPTVVRVIPLRQEMLGRYAAYASIVLIAANLVLLVACANLASLLVLRGRTRERQCAIELALGATPLTIVRGALVESLVLAGGGCMVALLIFALSGRILADMLPPPLLTYATTVFDGRVLLGSVALTAIGAIAACAIPAWRMVRLSPLSALRGRPHGRRRLIVGGTGGLVATEIAVSAVLAVAALLTARTLINVEAEDVGFEPRGLFTIAVRLPVDTDRSALLHIYADILDTLRHAPGVVSAAGADSLPMIGIVNRPMYGAAMGSQRCPATDGLVETLGMQVLAGRSLSADDLSSNAAVGVLSVAGLKLVWPGTAPAAAVGRRLEFPAEAPLQIVGVVSDVRQDYLAPSMPTLYVPLGAGRVGNVVFAVRMTSGAVPDEALLMRAFGSRGLSARSARVTAVQDAFEQSVVNQRFRARLFTAFGIVAVLLGMLGIHAVLSSDIASRERELAIRVSLGATTRDVAWTVGRDVAFAVVPGILIGLLVAWWAGGALESMLYGIDADDPVTFALVALLLGGAAAVAVYAPVRRARRTALSHALLRL